jgi:hypothetical protein
MNPLVKIVAAGLGAGMIIVAAIPPALALPERGRRPAPATMNRPTTVGNLIASAVEKLRSARGDHQEALRLLRRALQLGAAKNADWHAAFALLGLRIKAPDSRVAKSCLTALRLDPKNELAKGVLFELTKRRVMARGKLNPTRGQDKARPIKLTGLFAEDYAYLTLFGVKSCGDPVFNPQKTLVAYVCRSRAGKIVTYYFDRTAIVNPNR